VCDGVAPVPLVPSPKSHEYDATDPSGSDDAVASKARIDTARGAVDEAFPPMSITLELEDDLDISRGDLFCRPNNQPMVTQDVEAMVCWISDSVALTPRSRLVVKPPPVP
jgi:sulfate adenylyltransferase subunit 1 (EFTu-like GTPase family)